MNNKYKKKSIVAVAIFSAMIGSMYFIWTPLKDKINEDVIENRNMAERPTLNIHDIGAYPDQANSYVNDHLPFRGTMVKMNSAVDYYVFHSSSNRDDVIGKNGWLFYNQDDTMPIYKGQKLYSEDQLQTIANNIQRSSDYLERQGVKYVVYIAPEKERIYPEYTATPMSVCSAMSQGYIGYDLQNAIRTELLNRGIYKPVSTVLTQVTVDPYDEAFYHPTKIIGRVMTEEEAEAEEKKGNHTVKQGDGYRRIVAAPKPMDIVEIDAIRALSDADQVVIACGGGGIPVLEQDNNLKGASAVIEKDLAAGKLAELLDADQLIILTSVERVCLNYGTANEQPLDEMTVEEAKQYIDEGQFEEGTMLPKIQAAIDYIGNSAVRSVLIANLEEALDGVSGLKGTLIHK